MNQSLSTFNELFDLVYVGKLPTLKSTIEKFNDFDVTALCDLVSNHSILLFICSELILFVCLNRVEGRC